VLEREQAPVRIHDHADRVEAQQRGARPSACAPQCGVTALQQPAQREPAQPPALRVPDALEGRSRRRARSRPCTGRLDLDESQHVAVVHDQVDLPARAADVAIEDPKTSAAQVCGG
jgi:hypothetical protein